MNIWVGGKAKVKTLEFEILVYSHKNCNLYSEAVNIPKAKMRQDMAAANFFLLHLIMLIG